MATIHGEIQRWKVPGNPQIATREWSLTAMSFATLREVADLRMWNTGSQNAGVQRNLILPHAKKIKKEILAGHFTPTAFSLAFRDVHREEMESENDSFTLEVGDDKLPLIDGQHRLKALEMIMEDFAQLVGESDNPEARTALRDLTELQIPVMILIDCDPELDFLRLQEGRPVDKAQQLSMKVSRQEADPNTTLAWEIARELDSAKDGPFTGCIRFNTEENALIPVTTLCSTSSSDVATSLLGAAKLMKSFGKTKPSLFTDVLSWVIKTLSKKCPEVFLAAKVLTPPSSKGTKGAATMLVGLTNCVLWRFGSLGLLGKKIPQEEEELLAEKVVGFLDIPVEGSFTSSSKRQYLGLFAGEYFADLEEKAGQHMHEGIPAALQEILSSSSFGVSPIPGKRGRPPKKLKAESEPEKQLKPKHEKIVVIEPEPELEPEPEPEPVAHEEPTPKRRTRKKK